MGGEIRDDKGIAGVCRVQFEVSAVVDIAAAQRAASGGGQRSLCNGGAAAVAVVVTERQLAAALFYHVAAAADDAAVGGDIVAIKRQRAVVNDVAVERAQRAAVANLQRRAAIDGRAFGGHRAVQYQRAGFYPKRAVGRSREVHRRARQRPVAAAGHAVQAADAAAQRTLSVQNQIIVGAGAVVAVGNAAGYLRTGIEGEGVVLATAVDENGVGSAGYFPLTGQGVAGAVDGYAIGVAQDCSRISERIVIAVELNGGICRDGAARQVIERVARGDVDAEYRGVHRAAVVNRDSAAVGIDARVPGAFTRCGNGAGVGDSAAGAAIVLDAVRDTGAGRRDAAAIGDVVGAAVNQNAVVFGDDSASAFGRDLVIAASDTDAGAGGGDLTSTFGRYLVAAAFTDADTIFA